MLPYSQLGPIPQGPFGDGDCSARATAGRKYRAWASAEYLLWWTRGESVPVPLVTSSTDVPLTASSGSLGGPGTSVLLGGNNLYPGIRSGGRFTLGTWLDPCGVVGVEGSYLFLASNTITRSVGTSGAPGSLNLFEPFFDVSGAATGTGLPGEAAGNGVGPAFGSAGVFTLRSTNSLQGAELNGLFRLSNQAAFTLDVLAGMRWVQLHEDLTLDNNTLGLPGGPIAGQVFNQTDDFNVRNNFYGGQVGMRMTYYVLPALSFSATGKVAVGDMNQTANVFGLTQTNLITGPGGPLQLIPGGAFTQPSNMGHYTRNVAAVVPEVDCNLNFQMTRWARFFVGYSFLYLSQVARPGDLIDHNINITQTGLANALQAAGVPGTAPPIGSPAPNFAFHESSFWAQGINFGLQFRY